MDKAYQSTKCQWGNVSYCPYGCLNGTCKSVPTNQTIPTNQTNKTCSAGWKCKDCMDKAYQSTKCQWSNVSYCSDGCLNGTCKSVPTNQTIPTNQTGNRTNSTY